MPCQEVQSIVIFLNKIRRKMDSTDLLAREETFRKLNNELQKKSVSLLKQIETDMQKQDIFNEFSPKLSLNFKENRCQKHSCTPKASTPELTPTRIPTRKKLPPSSAAEQSEQVPKLLNSECLHAEHEHVQNNTKTTKKDSCGCCSYRKANYNRNDELEFLYAFVSVNVQTKILPQSFLKDTVTAESICKYLSNKIRLLQEQIDKLQSTLDKKASQCEQHLTLKAEHESERLKLLNKSNNSAAEANDLRAKCAVLLAKLNEKDRIYKEQRSDADKLASQVKMLKSKMAAAEARAASYEEEVHKLKAQMESLRNAEKELRTSARSLSQSHTSAISRLESKVKGLISTIEKQNALIVNLRQQNGVLTVSNAVKALEKEYIGFLTQA